MLSRTLVLSLALLAPATTFAASLPHFKRDLSTPSNLPGTWSYYGCYSDDVQSRQLAGKSYSDDSMTDEACVNFCTNQGYTFAGTEYGRECYCGFGLGSEAASYPNDCTMSCAGDSTEACGGPNRLTVFTNGQSGPVENSGSNGWYTLGCYSDSPSQRTLSYGATVSGGSSQMTVAKCTSECAAEGYEWAGVEYSGECYCGHSIGSGGSYVSGDASQSGCNMPCNGNSSEYCGGSNRLNLYHHPTPAPSGSIDLGCYTDNPQQRALGVAMPVPGDYNNMTIENCVSVCQGAGYVLAGVEYARECYCDNSFHNGGAPAPYPPNRSSGDLGCNMPCTGNGAEICGGSNRLNVYSITAGSSSTTTTSTTTTSATTTAVASFTTTTISTVSATATPTTSSSTVVLNSTFDQGSSGWSTSTNGNAGNLYGAFDQSLNAYKGAGYAYITESGYGDSGTRSLCLSTTVYIAKAGTYNLNFVTGRIPNLAPGKTSTTDHIDYSVFFAGTSYGSGSVCGAYSTCPLNAENGKAYYQPVSLTVTSPSGYETLAICATYYDPRRGGEDYWLLDEVTMTGPN